MITAIAQNVNYYGILLQEAPLHVAVCLSVHLFTVGLQLNNRMSHKVQNFHIRPHFCGKFLTTRGAFFSRRWPRSFGRAKQSLDMACN